MLGLTLLLLAKMGEESDFVVNFSGELEAIHESGGADAMREELRMRSSSRARVTRNNWQAAMYDALASSAWFCEGGYRSIVPQPL